MSHRKRYGYLSLEEATNFLEELINSDDSQGQIIESVIIEPPSGYNLQSDEDSGEEDGSGLPENLPRALLMEPCDIIVRQPENTASDEDEENMIQEALDDIMQNSTTNIDIDLLTSSVITPSVLDYSYSTEEQERQKSPSKSLKRKVPRKSPTKSLKRKVPRKSPTKSLKRKVPRTEYAVNQQPSTSNPITNNKKSKSRIARHTKSVCDPATLWVADEDIQYPNKFPEPDYSDCANMSPHEQFEKFVDDELLQMICEESNNYAVYCGQVNPNITVDEMRVFIGILIITGYKPAPAKKLNWSNGIDVQNLMVSNAMRRQRFETIFRSIHFIDNAKQQVDDKIWKLRPYTDALKKRFIKHFHPERCLSYDESMVEYYGRHGCKQFIRGKPLRFGYKMWSLNTPLGYLINFEMYQGSNPRLKQEYFSKFGKNITPLFCMLDEFNENIKNLEFSFHFDNLFTTPAALLGLKQRGYHGTGTIRENFIPKSCPLPRKDELKKKNRGHIESAKMESTGIKLTKWVDNAVVNIASTIHGKLPISKAGRYSRLERKKIMVPLPNAVSEYNHHMGGTDRMDQNVNAYRIGARGKKWWFSIFTWLLDVSIQNAWILHRKGGNSMSQLDFRRAIAARYCQTNGSQKPPQSYRRVGAHDMEYSSRFDRIDHFVVETTGKKRRRCAGQNCQAHPLSMCKKCNVGLCLKCFEKYHFYVNN